MARRQKLLASVLALVSIIAIVLFNHPFHGTSPGQISNTPAPLNLVRTEADSKISPEPAGQSEKQISLTIGDQPPDDQDLDMPGRDILVTGHITTEFGEIVPDELVTFYSPSINKPYSTLSSKTGEFRAEISPADDYQVAVYPRGMYKPYRRSSIDLSDGLANHNITLQAFPVGMLQGTVVDSVDRPVVGLNLAVRSLEKRGPATSLVTDATGTFSLERFPVGMFRVSFGADESFTSTGINFDPDGEEEIRIKIDRGPHSLSGHVYVDSGQFIDGAHVVLTWINQRNEATSRSTRQTIVDATGAFQFHGLGSGEHELIVSAWKDGAFKQTIRKSVNLGVDPGDQNIVLNPY